MRHIFFSIFAAIVFFGIIDLKGQMPYVSNKNDLRKFTGVWNADVNGKLIKLTLKSRIKFYDSTLKSYVDKIEGHILMSDSNNNVLYGDANGPKIINAYLDGKNSNGLNGTYVDVNEGLVAEAQFQYDAVKKSLVVILNDPNQNAIRFKAKNEITKNRRFKIPKRINFFKS